MDLRPDSWDGLQFQSSSVLFHVNFIDFDSAQYVSSCSGDGLPKYVGPLRSPKLAESEWWDGETQTGKTGKKWLNMAKLVRLLEAKIYVAMEHLKGWMLGCETKENWAA